jgi:hypothetical protein
MGVSSLVKKNPKSPNVVEQMGATVMPTQAMDEFQGLSVSQLLRLRWQEGFPFIQWNYSD